MICGYNKVMNKLFEINNKNYIIYLLSVKFLRYRLDIKVFFYLNLNKKVKQSESVIV